MLFDYEQLLAVCSLSAIDAKTQGTEEHGNWMTTGRQIIDYLVDKHVADRCQKIHFNTLFRCQKSEFSSVLWCQLICFCIFAGEIQCITG